MAESNNRFAGGKMNKDFDERLVPNNEYRDALNVQTSTSDGSDVGTLQNLMGNVNLSASYFGGKTDGFHCIGSIKNDKSNTIYWMLAGEGVDVIAEYDYATGVVAPVVVDVYSINVLAGPGNGRVLNFDKNFLITGINIIEGFLFWTDNNTEPKQINIDKCKLGSTDFYTHTVFYVSNPQQSQSPPFVPVGDIKESHITVIKKSPLTAPKLVMKNTNRGDIDNDGTPGVIKSQINIDDPVVTLIDPNDSANWMPNQIAFETTSVADFKPGDFLELTPVGTDLVRLTSIIIEITTAVTVSGGKLSFNAEIVSGTAIITQTSNLFDVVLQQKPSLFEFKFPRFAYRYKYVDGQYSTFSPFSEVAFLPGEFDYLPKEGYNLGMVNNLRSLAVRDFVDKKLMPEDVASVDILYKESNSPVIYIVETVKRVDIVTTAGIVAFDSWNGISIDQVSDTLDTTGFLNIKSETIHAVIPSNQLLRGWDNVPRKALAQEVIGNRVVYANYLQNYNMSSLRAQGRTAFQFYPELRVIQRDNDITVDLKLSHLTSDVKSLDPELLNPSLAHEYSPAKSIKTLRTYQLGVVYIDEFGRETPVFTSSKIGRNSIKISKETANLAGQLKAQVFSATPDFAKNFKFLIKESSNEYYNLAMDRWYAAQDGNIWLSFPSAERNKVDEETFLILKKGHNQDDAVLDDTRYKILAIDNEAPLFIKTRRVPRGSITSAPIATVLPPAPPEYTLGVGNPGSYGMNVGFPQPGGTYISIEKSVIQFLVDKITETGLVDWQFRINNGLSSSAWYSLKSVEEDATDGYYEFTSKKRFGPDMNVSSTVPWTGLLGAAGASTTLTVEFVKKEVRNLPEFDGRFFVKILKDATIKKHVEGIPVVAGNNWVVKGSITSQYINPQTTYSNTWPSPAAIGKYYGVDPKRISISKSSNSAGANTNAHAHTIHDAGNGNAGEVFWQNAGSTPYAASKSSGWFIDKIEAFRPFQMTGGSDGWNYGGNDDKSYVTNPASGWVWRGAFFGNEHPNSEKQLQLCGNDTYNNAGANTYLGNSLLKQHGTKLRNSTKAYGGIIPSVGIDATDNIIHLSFVGVGPESTGGNITSLSQLKTHFGEAVWAQSFVREQSFVDAITTPGTLWRWKEDPDGIINRTKGWNPSMTSVTNAEWNKNSYDNEDGKNGISLYNYATFQDYPVRHKITFTATYGPDGGALPLTAFVSQGVPNHTINSGTTIGAGIALGAYLLIGTAADIPVDLGNYGTSGGWGTLGVTSSAHFKYPCMTKDWGQPRNRRRRFMFAAAPFIAPAINNGDIIDQSLNIGLGATPLSGNYLPTNDPTTAPHFDDAGILLPSSIGVPRPATAAPGIRPDGMYSGHTDGTDTIPGIKTTTDGVDQSHIPGSVTWEIVEPYTESDDESTFTTTNPAIWETEPKENIDLDLYHEVGQIYPTKLDGSSLSQFVGPIRSSRALNTKVECWHPIDGWVLLNSGSGLPGADDIRVFSHDRPVDASGVEYGEDTHVWLQDVNGFQLTGNDDVVSAYPTHVIPTIGSRLLFTREDGSRTESTVKSQHPWMPPVAVPGTTTVIPASSLSAFELEEDTHNYEVVLPWFNCYSFGNGVESNRIRDDYNQVFIDKGAKVSTVLEEPYMEDKRSSGFIYSGIFNSTSNVNNLNQFIQAEKITKDLNPDGGSIQKLFARDTDLVTLCEDKIFKVLANKDALYNADGDAQLVATNNVLGTATTFSGDYGISTNPESFASESFRMYFTDKARGAVLRLSRDGLTPISSAGMTDWFNDNLATSNRLIGSYDDKKKEYNLTLGFFNFNSFIVGILSMGSLAVAGGPVDYTPKPPGVLVLNSSKANKFSVGDEVSGPGIPHQTVVAQKINMGGGQWWLKLNNTPLKADMAALGLPVIYGPLPSGPGPHKPNDAMFMTRVTVSRDRQPSQTLTWSESGKGWVSFKSFIQENGISINNDYFTFSSGMLYKHHANEVHNLFYDSKMPAESTVQILFNEVPGSVKSFSTLNYEGSESHITQDITNSGEYWDNQRRLGWYVDNIYTDLQQGDRHEFKDKEGKWFSQIQGVTTEWLDDGKSGNLDSNEFSYQGIDENYGAKIITGGYTSWNCQAPLALPMAGSDANSTQGYANLTRGGTGIGNGGCVEIPGLSGTYATEVDCYADVNTYCGDPCQNLGVFDAYVNTLPGYYDNGLCIDGGAYLTVAMEPTATSWVVSYMPVDPVTLVSIGTETIDPNLYTFSGDSDITELDTGSWLWTVTDNNGCSLNNYFVVGCAPVYGCTDTLALNYDPLATVDDGSCVIPVSGCTDPLATNYDPTATVDDGSCVLCVYGCTDSTATNYDPLATCDDGSCIASIYGCTDPLASNYYAGANIDDGSCVYPVFGCTDQWAINYNPLATNDDGSCFGPCSGNNWPGGFTSLGQPYGNTQLYFEQALYANGVDNQNPNTGVNLGKFRTKYACGVTNLNLDNKGICDLTGLEAFWDLETINLGNNGGLTNNDACELREIPTSTFPKLRVLNANRNHFSQSGIDLSTNLLLEILDLSFNNPGGNGTPSGHIPLTTLDLTNNPLLKKCYFRQSTISDVDLSTNNGNLTKLTYQQSVPGTIINLGINVDLTTLSFSCGLSSNMTVKVGTVARANQGNALMLTGGSAPFGGVGHWSVTGASVTFIQ